MGRSPRSALWGRFGLGWSVAANHQSPLFCKKRPCPRQWERTPGLEAQGPDACRVPQPRCLPAYRRLSFPQVIFRFALALFKYKEEEIMRLQDSMSIFKYLRSFSRTILDAR